MTSAAAHLWIRTADGELVRSDVITGLRCHGGQVEADRADGGAVQLAGPGCPPDFHLQLLRQLASPLLVRDVEYRRTVIVTAQITSDSARWVDTRVDELLYGDAAITPG